uniref:Ig-like domain-containing protein n=1 Tax=Callorhinchus milii TaxID=7868 RepID=A0A4W3GX04_CALMI
MKIIFSCSFMFIAQLCDGDSVTQKAVTMVKKAGETVIPQCTSSKTESDFILSWYRHYPGKQLEFIIRRYSWDDDPLNGTGFGNRFSLVVSDSAVYYCETTFTSNKRSSKTFTSFSVTTNADNNELWN